MHHVLHSVSYVDSPLIMFWNVDVSRLHSIWVITLIFRFTWFDFLIERSWKIPGCGWCITCLFTIPQISFLEIAFSHGNLRTSSQLANTQPSFIFSLPILLKLPWWWECCSFFLGKMTLSNALLYYFINTCPTVTWTAENSPIDGFHHLFITSLIKMSNQNLFLSKGMFVFVLCPCLMCYHFPFIFSPHIYRKMSKTKQSLILDN